MPATPLRAWSDPCTGRILHQALGTQAATQIIRGQAKPGQAVLRQARLHGPMPGSAGLQGVPLSAACIPPSLARTAAARQIQSCAAAAWAKTRRTDSPLPPSAGGEASTSSAACLSAIERTMDMPSP